MTKFLLALLASAVTPAIAAAAPPPQKPKLIVMIAVDQFSAELWEKYKGSYTGGLKRLDGGVAFAQGYQSHAATETCPGHSTMLTGRHPSGTGIVANEWIDRATGKPVYCVSIAGHDGATDRGALNIKATTLGDWMKEANPANRVVTISGKDRAAIALAGHKADAVYWWNDGDGFVTSSFAGPSTPAVTDLSSSFNADVLARWKQSPPALWPAAAPASCTALAKPHTFGTFAESGQIPPEFVQGVTDGADFPASPAFQLQLRNSTLFDPLVEEFAGKVIDGMKLGHGAGTDLLGVSFSATDYVGHRFGNGGAEMCVQQQVVDAAIGRLLAKIDSLHVPYVVALTADHGATDAAERETENGTPAQRIDARSIVIGLNAALRQKLSLDRDPLIGADANELYFRPGLDAATASAVTAAAVPWLKARPEVSDVHTRAEIEAVPMPRGEPRSLTILQRYRESYDAERSGDIFIAFQERASIGLPKKFGDSVAGHGSVWDYDRRVPILFWWPGVRGAQPTAAAETVDIAPTLAAIARIPAPPVDGACLKSVAASRCGR
ncbi:alkaline phosphatase family protein [Sphingomonas sp. AP4-R1]|uniref:alkaline phosphatase family protein n=1 Tax=Sphingomonas sp. AP4-R1 TaxID=2735134 RepID=UPI0014932D11|nr:alkaline phosphatase family protein [Sphingomonas sp. AP4-R1]QJU58945.1 alkaline phosphatase family protein [Sphingomonas sp. AP4-R1]